MMRFNCEMWRLWAVIVFIICRLRHSVYCDVNSTAVAPLSPGPTARAGGVTGRVKGMIQLKWCGTESREERMPKIWRVPSAVAGDVNFTVTFKPGWINCETGDIFDVALALKRPPPVRRVLIYNEDLWSTGYFRFDKDYYNRKEFCISELDDVNVTITFCKTPECGPSNPCITKCCALNKLVTIEGNRTKGCLEAHAGSAPFRPALYKKPFSQFKTREEYHFRRRAIQCPNSGLLLLPHETNEAAISTLNSQGLCYRIKPDGTMMYRDKNYEWNEVSHDKYCLDGFQYEPQEQLLFSGEEGNYGVFMCGDPTSNQTNSNLHSAIYGVALLSSSVFLFITFVVYVMLWSQHSIHGWITMCHSAAMFFMYLFLGLTYISRITPEGGILRTSGCEIAGILTHFFFLASFCWFTVINFDLYWTFRGINLRGFGSKGTRRFCMYAAAGWGLPTITVSVSVMLDQMYRSIPCNMFPIPAYGLHRKCYMDTAAMGPYMYYPVGCLLLLDLIFFLTTSYKLFEYKQSTRMATQTVNERQQLFTLISKLFVVMGVTWIFEFVSWYHSGDEMKWYWVIFDVINCLQAVAIFVIYVCKPDILRSLMNAYPVLKPCLSPLGQCFRIGQVRTDVDQSETYATSTGKTSVKSKSHVSGVSYKEGTKI